jgi:hypothetical protein
MRVPVEKSAFCSTLTRGWSRFALLSLSILGVLLAGAAPVLGQAPAASPAQAKAPAPMAHAAPQNAGGGRAISQGIQVHGYWKIDVRNPDGSLARHVEFENKLATSNVKYGPTVLVNLLRGTTVSLGPAIQIGATSTQAEIPTGNPPPPVSFNLLSGHGPCGGNDCLIAPSDSAFYSNCLWIAANQGSLSNNPGYNSSTCVGGLSVSASGYDPSQDPPTILPVQNSLTLSGYFVASTSSQLEQVGTIMNVCRFDVYQSGACAAPSTPGSSAVADSLPYYLTSYAIPAPSGSSTSGISVTAGQSVNVQVTLSFQ